MTTATTIFLTYGVTLTASIFALAGDAFGRRTAALVIVVAGLAVSAAGGLAAGVLHTRPGPFGTVAVGGPTSMLYGVIAFVGMAAVLGGFDSLRKRASGGSIAALVAFAVATGGGVAAALDLTTLLLLLETLALIGYALVAVAGTSRSAESSMKYFVQGAVATGFFLFGMAVLVGLYAPSGAYVDLAKAFVSAKPLLPALAGAGLILAALVFKMGAVPFHSWAPDVYETAPVELAAFLASGPKLAAIGATAVFVSVVTAGADSMSLLVVVAAIAALSVLVGSIAALRQGNYRRLLAYAGIAQTGYALIAVAIPMAPLAVFYGSTYAIASTGTFLAAAAFARLRPEWDGSVAGLAGLGRRAPLLSGSVAILLISLAGLPPFLGFWAKLTVFGSGLTVASGRLAADPVYAWSIILAVVAGVVGSVVSLGYYGAVLRSLFFDATERSAEPIPQPDRPSSTGGSAVWMVVVLAVVVVALSALPLVVGSTALFDLFSAR